VGNQLLHIFLAGVWFSFFLREKTMVTGFFPVSSFNYFWLSLAPLFFCTYIFPFPCFPHEVMHCFLRVIKAAVGPTTERT
jgi:hypothetical protein